MPTLSEWVVNSWSLHKNLSYELGSRVWDEFKYPEEKNHLFQKIAVAFFGEPKSSDDNLGLNEKQETLVRSIIEKCLKYSYDKQKIKIAIIFVSIYKNKSFTTDMPLIRVMTFHSKLPEDVPKSKFIDLFGRVYDDLKNFIDTNTWDNSYVCFPKNGYYKMDLTICLKKPEIKDEVLEVADKVSNVMNISTSASMLVGIGMTLFPPTAPIGMLVAGYSAIAGAPGAVYGVGRSVGKIIDRSSHEQSISLLDSEARQCWLVTASAVASVGALASTKILTSMATSGRVLSTTARGACTGINLASVGLSGISVMNSAYELSTKEGEVTSLEIIQLTTSILFLTHSVVSFKTAKTIIQEAQQNEIARIRSSVSPEHQEKYNSILKNTKRSMNKKTIPSSERNMLGQAEFIRKMKKIDNPNEYFSNFKITTKGNYCLNKKLSITPKKFQNLSEHERQTLLNSSKDLQDRKISLKAFNKKVQPIVKKYKIFVRKGVKPQNNLRDTGNTKNNTRIRSLVYSDSKSEKNENVLGLGNSRDTRLTNQIKMATTKIISNIEALNHKIKDFAKIMRIIFEKIKSEVNRRYQENSDPPRSSETDPEEHYVDQVSKDFLTDGHPLNLYLNSLFTLIASCEEKNIKIPKQCFEIILDMVKQNIQNVQWFKNDNIFQCSFTSENCTDFKVQIHFIETECFVYLYEVKRTLIDRAHIYDMNNFVSKVDSHVRAYLTDLETSCKEQNIQIPRECLEVLLEKSQGKPHNVTWNKSGNFIESSFSTSTGDEITVDFHINNNKFITNSYKNSCHLIEDRVCKSATIEEYDKGVTDSEGEDDSDDEGDDSLQFLAYLVRKLSSKKEANEIVDILIRNVYPFHRLTEENIQIIKDFTSNKIMEVDFKMRNDSSIYNKSDSSVMENDYLASVIHRECLSRGSRLNVCLMSFIYLVISYQRNHINTPKQCLEFIMEKVKGEIALNRIRWSRNGVIVECHYLSPVENIKMNFEVIKSNLVAKYIDDKLEEIKVYDLNVEEEYPEYLLDNDDTSGL